MKILPVLLFIAVFTACSTQNTAETNTNPVPVLKPYIINTLSDRERAKGEKDKCMKGVCLEGEFSFGGINDFEKKTDTDNDVYIEYMNYSDKFPATFIIDCISKGKIPMLILGNNISDIEGVALRCGSLAQNMFVAFDYGKSTELYNQSAEIFRKYAPDTALMWYISSDDEYEAFPKEEYVDWVLLRVDEDISNGKINSKLLKLRDNIKYFANKAVALNISVQNFSGGNHRYYTNMWNNEVCEIYKAAGEYENVGLVSYVHNSEYNRVYGSSRLSESRLIWQGYKEISSMLPQERKWTSTGKIAYISDDTAYIKNDDARLLDIDARYANNKYAAIKNYYVDNSSGKMFVNSAKMLYNKK